MSKTTARRAATFFAISNILAGVLHYAFQIWSGMRLNAVDFGQLNSWMAYLSVALSLSAFAQYFANFKVARGKVLISLASAGIAAAALASLLPFLFGDAIGWTQIGICGLILAIAFSWFVGQAQIRLMFHFMGSAILLMAAAKFILAFVPFPVEHENKALAWAVSLGYAPALAFACVGILRWAKEAPVIPERSIGQSLWAPLLLALATVYIPQFDIIVIHQTQEAEVIGQFARVSILYKAVFFSFLIIAQIVLPYQLRATSEKTEGANVLLGRVSLLVRLQAMVISLVLAGIVYGLSDFAMAMVGWDLSEVRAWILLSCLNMALLTNIFFRLQLDCVHGRMGWAGLLVGLVLLEALIAIQMQWPVGEYLVFALVYNFCLWLVRTLRA